MPPVGARSAVAWRKAPPAFLELVGQSHTGESRSQQAPIEHSDAGKAIWRRGPAGTPRHRCGRSHRPRVGSAAVLRHGVGDRVRRFVYRTPSTLVEAFAESTVMDEKLGDSVKPATAGPRPFRPRWAFVSSGIALKAPDPTVVTESGSSTSVSSVPEGLLPTETRPSLRPRWVSRRHEGAVADGAEVRGKRSSAGEAVPTSARPDGQGRGQSCAAIVETVGLADAQLAERVFSEGRRPISVTASPMVTSLSWELRSGQISGTAVSESGRDEALDRRFENAPSQLTTASTAGGPRQASRYRPGDPELGELGGGGPPCPPKTRSSACARRRTPGSRSCGRWRGC